MRTTLLGPLDQAPPVEQLIIVPLTDGTCDTSNGVCLPAAARLRRSGAAWETETLATQLALPGRVPPYEWPSVCGRIGVVYVKGGEFADTPTCLFCAAQPAIELAA